MIYDYDKWTALEPSTVQNKLKVWPKDYTSIVVTTHITGEETYMYHLSVMVFFNSQTENLPLFMTKETVRSKTQITIPEPIAV